jgi:hypothetical protein
MSERGRKWDAAVTEAIGAFDRLLSLIEQDLERGADLAVLMAGYEQARRLSVRSVETLDHEPGPEHLPDERVRALGPRVQALGERLLALHERIGKRARS